MTKKLLLKKIECSEVSGYIGPYATYEDGEKMKRALIRIYGKKYNFYEIPEDVFDKIAEEIC